MKLARIFILYLFTGCLVYTATCQPAYPKPFKTLTVSDGLPQSFISGLAQDSTGFIWIGTRDGLARYDGREFKVFRHIPGDTTSLADNTISSIYLDRERRLWIFFEAGDIDVLNTRTEALVHFTNDPFYKPMYAIIKASESFAEDGNGNFWMLTLQGTVFICNPSKRTLRLYSPSNFHLPNNKIINVIADNKHVVLITDNSLAIFDGDQQLQKILPFTFPDHELRDAALGWKIAPAVCRKNGEIVLVDRGRVIIYHSSTQLFTTLPLPEKNVVMDFCITEDDKGQIFFDYNFNVYVLTLQNKLILWKQRDQNPGYGFKSMLVDKSGVFWLGGNGSGIRLYDLRLPRLQGIAYKKNFHEDVLHDLLKVDQSELQKTALFNMESYYLRWTKGLCNDIWFSSAGVQGNKEAEVYHYINGHLKTPPWHYTDTVQSHHIKINALAVSPSGKLWGIDFFFRPVLFDTLTYAVTIYPPLDSLNLNYNFTVGSLVIDKDDKFWISTALNGLFFYDKQRNKTIHYFADGSPGSLPTNQLMNIVQDKKNKNILWIGSLGGGLIKFDKSARHCSIYTTKEGLPNNTVYAVVIDTKGILWCSSNNGIFSFNPQTKEIRNYTSKDGLPGDEFNRYHYLQLPDGRIAFGGVDGYTVFNPLTLSKDNFQPTVALTGVQINNVASDFGNAASLFRQTINSLNKIELNYQQNFLTFQFAALEYNITDKLQYRYMLKGYDNDWINAGDNNEAVYTKLPPGDYTLKINATNTAGEWSSYIKTLAVIIMPPFWQTWWFITLMILVVAAIAYFLFQSRIIYIRKQERQKIKFEQEASELKAQALRAQMNPHFVFNSLNSIKALIQEDKKKQAVIYLTTFSKLIRNQLNNAEREVSLHDELETCKLYAQLEALRFGDKIVTEFKVDENIDIYSLKVPPLLLQPFIENAIWHGILPKQNGKVSVSVVGENGSINCLIDDNGIGREMAMHNKSQSSTYESKGMGLVKTRLTMYNNISANKASIEVIDKKDNDKPAGTLVIIKFKPEV